MRAVAVAVAVLSLASLTACGRSASKHRPKPVPPDQAEQLLHERVWLDHLPRSTNEKFYVAVFDESGAAIAQHRSVWRGDFELFFHEVQGKELHFYLPASGTEMHSSYRIEPVTGHDKVDVKLVIDHPPTGPREYLGFSPDGAELDASVGTIDAFLAQRFPTKH